MRSRRELLILASALILMLAGGATTGFPAPLGVLVLGMVIGSLIALMAMGLVLIYRTTRIINFAQADMGAAAAVLSVLLVGETGMNYFLAVGIGVAAGLALGMLIEIVVVRRFFNAPRLILTVVTIALTQLLVFIQVFLPRIFDLDFISVSFPTPFGASFRIPDPRGVSAGVLFDGNHVLAIAAGPLVVLALAAFLKLTPWGVAARGAAENSERAALLGVPVKRISTFIWTIAAGLSAVGALLRAPTVGLSITGGAFGPGLLVRTLAPAVVGRMENLPVTLMSALVLGVVDQAAYFRTGSQSVSNTILFVVILAALLLRRLRDAERPVEESSWKVVREVRPVPPELRMIPEVRWARPGVVGACVLGAGVAGLAAAEFRVGAMSLILIYAIVGGSLVLLTGWAGQISLGQIAFFGVGAAVCGTLVADLGIHLLPALVGAGVAGAAAAVLVGIPALRLRGLLLAVSTVGFGLFVSSMLLNRRYFPWLLPQGRIDRPVLFGLDLSSERTYFFFVLLLTALCFLSLKALRDSRTGRVLIASRDNDRATRSFGISVTRARLTAFAFSGFYAALAGGLYAIHQNAVIATAFGVEKSLQVFVMVVIGGLGSLSGAVIGAVYFFGIQYFLSGPVSLLASGVGMLVLLMVTPGGLGGIVYKYRDAWLNRVRSRRGIEVDSQRSQPGEAPAA